MVLSEIKVKMVVVGVCFFLCRSTGDRDSDEFGQLVRSLVGAPGG